MMLSKLLKAAEAVVIAERIAAWRDPTDDKVLELAVNAAADIVVSGDADLLVFDPFAPFPSCRPQSGSLPDKPSLLVFLPSFVLAITSL